MDELAISLYKLLRDHGEYGLLFASILGGLVLFFTAFRRIGLAGICAAFLVVLKIK